MPTEYINPDYVGGGSDGSLSAPWLLWSDITPVDGNTYLQKRDTIVVEMVEDETKPNVTFFDEMTTTIGSYYSDIDGSDDEAIVLPEIRHYIRNTDSLGWTQPDSGSYPNVWKYTFPEEQFAERDLLSIGGLDLAGFDPIRLLVDFINGAGGGDHTTALSWADAPSQEGDYQSWDGAAGDPACIYMYSVGNPITTYTSIYMTMLRYPPFHVRNPVSFTATNIRFYFNRGLRFSATTLTNTEGTIDVHDCFFGFSCTGIYIALSDPGYTFNGYQIYNNVISYMLEDGVSISGVGGSHKNGRIYGNTIVRTGQSVSIGAIYIAEGVTASAIEPNLIYNNTISQVYHDTLAWPLEGAGIYLDANTSHTRVYNNRILLCAVAIKDNSGQEGNYWEYNEIKKCDAGIIISDSIAVDNINISINNNTFYEVGNNVIPAGDAGSASQDFALIKFNESLGNAGSVVNIYNNILWGGDPVNSVGITITTNAISNGATINEGNNCFHNIGTNAVNLTPSNPVNSDPLWVETSSNNFNLTEISPCVGVGLKTFGNKPRPESLSGSLQPDTKVDIGAYQSTWDTNHPKNL